MCLPFLSAAAWICGLWDSALGVGSSLACGLSVDLWQRWIWCLGKAYPSFAMPLAFPHQLQQAQRPKSTGEQSGGASQRKPICSGAVSWSLEREAASPLSPSVLVWGKRPFKELVFSILSITASESGWVIKCQLTVNIKLLGCCSEI